VRTFDGDTVEAATMFANSNRAHHGVIMAKQLIDAMTSHTGQVIFVVMHHFELHHQRAFGLLTGCLDQSRTIETLTVEITLPDR
jgi:hypothetical protein